MAEFLRPNGSRGPDASPREARNTPLARRELLYLPGVRPHKVQLYGAATAYCPPRALLRLFREATQLKTVGAAVRAAGIEPRHVEIQAHAIGTTDRGSPAETVVADAAQRARIPSAIARGEREGAERSVIGKRKRKKCVNEWEK